MINTYKKQKLKWMAFIVSIIIIIITLIVLTNKEKKESADAVILSDAKKILHIIKDKWDADSEFDPNSITEKNIEQLLGISSANIEQLKVILLNDEAKIFFIGKNDLSGLTVCGTLTDLKISDDCKDTIVPVITLIGNKEVILELGATFVDSGVTAFDDIDGDLTDQVEMISNVNKDRIGKYTITYSVVDSSNNKTSITRTVTIEDTVGPSVSFSNNGNAAYTKLNQTTVNLFDLSDIDNGSLKYKWTNSLTVPPNESFINSFENGMTLITPLGATGIYYLWILGMDMNGNTSVTRSKLFKLDNTKPMITVNGATVTIKVGSIYYDAGATAHDNVDGNITKNIDIVSNVNLSVPGNYSVTYNVSDSAGNKATEVIRTVIVEDTEAPEIELIGDSEIRIEVYGEYIELGAIVIDNYDQDLEVDIDSSELNLEEIGTYYIRYNVTDSSGNEATEVIRTVIVEDTEAPEIELIGDSEIRIEVYGGYNELGAIVIDNYDQDLEVHIDGSELNLEEIGTYYVRYNVTDSSGNEATVVIRTVIVE